MHIQTESGRTTRIRTLTTTKPGSPSFSTSSKPTDAASKTNSKPTRKNRQLIFELAQIAIDGRVQIPHHHTGDRHRHQAALGLELVAALEQQQDAGKNDDVFETLGHGVPDAQQSRKQKTSYGAGHDAQTDSTQHQSHAFRQAVGTGCKGDTQQQHREQGAHRIDQHAFRFENGGDAGAEPKLTDQGADHGGSGDGHQCSEDQGHHPVPTEEEAHGRRSTGGRGQHAEQHQPLDGALLPPQPRDLEIQTALEQDHGHRELDDHQQPMPSDFGSIQPRPSGPRAMPAASSNTIPGIRRWRAIDWAKTPTASDSEMVNAG